jgi:hypothetical protein
MERVLRKAAPNSCLERRSMKARQQEQGPQGQFDDQIKGSAHAPFFTLDSMTRFSFECRRTARQLHKMVA